MNNMEITNTIKDKVMLPYFGQKVLVIGGDVVMFDKTWNWLHPVFKLKLKPLSSITDEDAIEAIQLIKVANTSFGFITKFSPIEKIKKVLLESKVLPFNTGQYLQSKGYDLPSYHLGGKTLFEAGIAIYE